MVAILCLEKLDNYKDIFLRSTPSQALLGAPLSTNSFNLHLCYCSCHVQTLHLVGRAAASTSRGIVTTKYVPYPQSEANSALFTAYTVDGLALF